MFPEARTPFAWMFEEITMDEQLRYIEDDARDLAEHTLCPGCGQDKEPERRGERFCAVCNELSQLED